MPVLEMRLTQPEQRLSWLHHCSAVRRRHSYMLCDQPCCMKFRLNTSLSTGPQGDLHSRELCQSLSAEFPQSRHGLRSLRQTAQSAMLGTGQSALGQAKSCHSRLTRTQVAQRCQP